MWSLCQLNVWKRCKNWILKMWEHPGNNQGRKEGWGGTPGARTPSSCISHFAKDMSLNWSTFSTWAKAMYYLMLPIINIPAPPSQNYPDAPLHSLTPFSSSLNSFHYVCNGKQEVEMEGIERNSAFEKYLWDWEESIVETIEGGWT